MPRSLLNKIFDYHFSFSTDRTTFSHDELNENRISGFDDKATQQDQYDLFVYLDMVSVCQRLELIVNI